jgi:hypothetical protein
MELPSLSNGVQVTYKSTSSVYKANQLLAEITKYPIIACDFETATKYTPEERAAMQAELDSSPTKRRRIQLESTLAATALDHPSHCTLTHCSIAISDHEAYVFILDNKRITDRILYFLTTTTQKQIWHNLSYDGRLIRYFTGKFPIDYEDTQIFAKTILNHTDNQQSLTGLKQLAGARYGSWALSVDNFELSHMYDDTMLLYSATDSCATYYVWESLNTYVLSNS